jgi:hypothetical protein
LHIREAQERVEKQLALLRRRIVQGTPTQATEGQLRQVEQTLLRMKEQRGHALASGIGAKVLDRLSR